MIAKTMLNDLVQSKTGATVIGLTGDLGAGKTTLVKALAAELGVRDTVASPTFVIAKFYDTSHARYARLIHIDAYRIEAPSEIETFGWSDMIADTASLIVIEWPEKIAHALPDKTTHFRIDHTDDRRHIYIV